MYSDLIYLPVDVSNYYGCYFKNSDIISCLYSEPIVNQSINVDEFFINSNYLKNETTYLISESDSFNFINKSRLTNDITYMNNFDDFSFLLLFYSFVFIGIPLFIFSRLFKKKY